MCKVEIVSSGIFINWVPDTTVIPIKKNTFWYREAFIFINYFAGQ